MSDEKSGEGRRKRRGGLRVPSDNVPRQSLSQSSDSIPVPVPEAIGLAASISESFGVASEPSIVPDDSIASNSHDPDELPTIVNEHASSVPLPTIQSADELVTQDEITTIAPDVLSSNSDAGADPVAVAPSELHHANPVGFDARESIGESIDIPFDDSDETLNTQIPAPLPGPDLTGPSGVAPNAIPRISARQDTVSEPEESDKNEELVESSPDTSQRSQGKPKKKPRFARALTMALNESDLEEVRNNVEEIRRSQEMLKSESNATSMAAESPVSPAEKNTESESAANPALADDVEVSVNEEAVPNSSATGMESGDVLLDEELVEVSSTSLKPKDPEGKAAEMGSDRDKATLGETPVVKAESSEEAPASSAPASSAPASSAPASSAPTSSTAASPAPASPAPASATPPAPSASPPSSPPVRAQSESEGAPSKSKEEPPPPPSTKVKTSAGKGPPPISNLASPPKPPENKKRRPKGWFDDIFDEDYLRTLPFLTPQATQFEANFVMESLGVEAGAQILDVGCGYGRHAMELAARGYHLVGLDNSLPLLLRGADEAQRRGLTINFIHGDMREMTFESQFDGAYCLFSSFGYFDDETNKQTAQNIARALKPGARFVVEVLNRDYLVADLPSRIWWEGEGCVVLEEVEFNYFSSRIVSNRSVVFDDGRQLEQEISLRSFSLHELGKFLHSVGFRVLEISGSMSTRGRFFGAHSRDIVVVAERRSD